jgi:lipid-binding SYLF domain-containing protein
LPGRIIIVSKSLKALLVATTLILGASDAFAASDPQDVVDSSWLTIGHLRKDPEFGVAKDLLGRARGVMIIPNLFKGGFIFGGEGGDAVLLVRDAQNNWSSPAFYTLTAASFGLQIGAETAEVVLFLMNQGAVVKRAVCRPDAGWQLCEAARQLQCGVLRPR